MATTLNWDSLGSTLNSLFNSPTNPATLATTARTAANQRLQDQSMLNLAGHFPGAGGSTYAGTFSNEQFGYPGDWKIYNTPGGTTRAINQETGAMKGGLAGSAFAQSYSGLPGFTAYRPPAATTTPAATTPAQTGTIGQNQLGNAQPGFYYDPASNGYYPMGGGGGGGGGQSQAPVQQQGFTDTNLLNWLMGMMRPNYSSTEQAANAYTQPAATTNEASNFDFNGFMSFLMSMMRNSMANQGGGYAGQDYRSMW